MTDRDLRATDRTAQLTGTASDRAAAIVQLLRAAKLHAIQVRVAALMGDSASAAVLGVDALPHPLSPEELARRSRAQPTDERLLLLAAWSGALVEAIGDLATGFSVEAQMATRASISLALSRSQPNLEAARQANLAFIRLPETATGGTHHDGDGLLPYIDYEPTLAWRVSSAVCQVLSYARADVGDAFELALEEAESASQGLTEPFGVTVDRMIRLVLREEAAWRD